LSDRRRTRERGLFVQPNGFLPSFIILLIIVIIIISCVYFTSPTPVRVPPPRFSRPYYEPFNTYGTTGHAIGHRKNNASRQILRHDALRPIVAPYGRVTTRPSTPPSLLSRSRIHLSFIFVRRFALLRPHYAVRTATRVRGSHVTRNVRNSRSMVLLPR